MANFESYSIGLAHQISKFSVDSLSVIEKLDKHSVRLSRNIDKLLNKISSHDYSSNRNEFLKDTEDINRLRKVIEIIATRKFQLSVKKYDFIDQNIKSLDTEISLLEKALERNGHSLEDLSGASSLVIGELEKVGTKVVGTAQGTFQDKRKGKRKQAGDASVSTAAGDSSNVLTEQIVASAEPVYCICKRIAFGDMVACDNDECPIEWFHYTCVSLTKKPKNSWLCPSCSSTKKFKK
jgi:hypothetical protein